jgi:hypothetical protein
VGDISIKMSSVLGQCRAGVPFWSSKSQKDQGAQVVDKMADIKNYETVELKNQLPGLGAVTG